MQAANLKLGPLRIDHPYALRSSPRATNGAAYLRRIRNTGDQPDRLIGASTPVARAVEIHRRDIDPKNVMRLRAIEHIELSPKVRFT